MHRHQQSSVPRISVVPMKLACHPRISAEQCVACKGPLYDGSQLNMDELVDRIQKTERTVPSKVYRNKTGSIQTAPCPIRRIWVGVDKVIWGFIAIVVGLAIPVIVNWL